MTTRPNIVVFVPDQLRYDSLGCSGNPVVQTPNIDAFAATGTRFTNAFGQHPFCSPSRVSFLTGWYPHVHGHRTLYSLIKPWQPDVFGVLKQAGYHVAHVGMRGDTWAPGRTKESTSRFGWHVAPERLWNPSPYGPDHRLGRAFYHGRRDEAFVDFDEAALLTAEHWLAEGLPEPFVLYVPLVFPHPPFEVEEPWYSLHDRGAVPGQAPITTGPEAPFKQRIRDTYGTGRLDDDEWRELIATYYGMISRIDDQFGRLLTAIEQAGVDERTAVLFFPDHGEYLGDQGLVEKWIAGVDDCLVHNPLIARMPGGAQGRVEAGMVELVDVPATLADLAQTSLDYDQFGRSLVPMLAGEASSTRSAAFTVAGLGPADHGRGPSPSFPYDLKHGIEHDHPEVAERVVAMRTPEWTMVQRVGGPDELYDRVADPTERHNVIADPTHAPTVGDLRGGILDFMMTTSDLLPVETDPRLDTEGALRP